MIGNAGGCQMIFDGCEKKPITVVTKRLLYCKLLVCSLMSYLCAVLEVPNQVMF